MTVALTSSAIVIDLFKQEAHDRSTASDCCIAHDRSTANDCCIDIECDCY